MPTPATWDDLFYTWDDPVGAWDDGAELTSESRVVVGTEYFSFARWTVGGTALGVGTVDALRAGLWHAGVLAQDASLEERFIEGVASGQQVTLIIGDRADPDDGLLAEDGAQLLDEEGQPLLAENPYIGTIAEGLEGVPVTVETVAVTTTWDDGSTTTRAKTQILTVQGSSAGPGRATLTLVDLEERKLNAVHPSRVFATADFPDISTDDVGEPVPEVVGTALKIPCTLISSAPGDFRYLVCSNLLADLTVLAVYRDGRLVPPAEYTAAAGVAPFAYTYLQFTSEQFDFSGNAYTIEADIDSTEHDRNCTAEVQRLLTLAGVSIDAATFATADAWCAANAIDIDAGYGRKGQRTIRAIVEDLLYVARATLRRNAVGEYAILQDVAGAIDATLNEGEGDAIEVVGDVQRPSRPSSVAISYRPSSRDPDTLQHTVLRAVPGGSMGPEQPRALEYVRDHAVADQTLHYRAKRAQFSRRLVARILGYDLDQGDVVRITSLPHRLVASTWRLWDCKQIPGGIEAQCVEYDASLHTYVPGTLPDDAIDAYQPDYSSTEPLAPTALTITAGATALAADGTLAARVAVKATPPTVNWEAVWFTAIHNVTGEIAALVRGDYNAGSNEASTTLAGLRPGEVYQLKAYAVNGFNVDGVVQGTFNATAIGGGATDTTFAAAGYATAPATVGSCTANQGSALSIEVAWTNVATANLAEYVLERKVGAGSFAEYWRGRATNMIDRAVAYGTAYQYRVRARDTFGNMSAAYATSGSVTPSANIFGGTSGNDIAGDTVAPSNRTAVSSVTSVFDMNGIRSLRQSFSHSLGRIPLTTLDSNTSFDVIAHIHTIDSSGVTVQWNWIPAGTGGAGDGGTSTMYFW